MEATQSKDFRKFGCQSEDRFIFILMKIKHPFCILLFEMVPNNVNVMPPFIFLRHLRLNMEKTCQLELQNASTGFLLKGNPHSTQMNALDMILKNLMVRFQPWRFG